MTKNSLCPICGENKVKAQTESQKMEFRGITIEVNKLRSHRCSACETEFQTPDDIDSNARLVRETFIESREDYKHHHGLLTGSEIKRIREELGLSQAEASKLFGGGANAFSKYETETVVQSEAMNTLLLLVEAHPLTLDWLASRKDVKLKTKNKEQTLSRAVSHFEGDIANGFLMLGTNITKGHVTILRDVNIHHSLTNMYGKSSNVQVLELKSAYEPDDNINELISGGPVREFAGREPR